MRIKYLFRSFLIFSLITNCSRDQRQNTKQDGIGVGEGNGNAESPKLEGAHTDESSTNNGANNETNKKTKGEPFTVEERKALTGTRIKFLLDDKEQVPCSQSSEITDFLFNETGVLKLQVENPNFGNTEQWGGDKIAAAIGNVLKVRYKLYKLVENDQKAKMMVKEETLKSQALELPITDKEAAYELVLEYELPVIKGPEPTNVGMEPRKTTYRFVFIKGKYLLKVNAYTSNDDPNRLVLTDEGTCYGMVGRASEWDISIDVSNEMLSKFVFDYTLIKDLGADSEKTISKELKLETQNEMISQLESGEYTLNYTFSPKKYSWIKHTKKFKLHLYSLSFGLKSIKGTILTPSWEKIAANNMLKTTIRASKVTLVLQNANFVGEAKYKVVITSGSEAKKEYNNEALKKINGAITLAGSTNHYIDLTLVLDGKEITLNYEIVLES